MNEMNNEFEFSCPTCGAKLSAIEEWEGIETDCPNCGKKLIIPAKNETEVLNNMKVEKPLAMETNSNLNLIKCPTCGKQVSINASTCPHCGEPLREECWIIHDGGLDTILLLGIVNTFGHCKVNKKFAFVLVTWIVALFVTIGIAQNDEVFYWCEKYSDMGMNVFLIGFVLTILMSIIPFSRGKWYNVLSYIALCLPLGIWAIPYLSVLSA